MANKFIGEKSRKISALDESKPLSVTDKIIFSIKQTPTTTSRFTRLMSMETFNNVQLQYFVDNHLDDIIKPNFPVDFKETANNGFALNLENLDNIYYPNIYNPFSMAGTQNDFRLPISGSYFGVIQREDVTGFSQVAYAERDTTITILKPVTNGEVIRWTYSFINRENVVNNTDIVYVPPGLSETEFVGYVHQPNDNFMVIEIHDTVRPFSLASTGSFKEWAIVELNNTMNQDYHVVKRIGRSLSAISLTGANEVQKCLNAITITRNTGLCLLKHSAKFYFIHELSKSLDSTVTAYRGLKIWSLTDTLALEPETGWSATNALGKTYVANGNSLTLYQDKVTLDENNQDALFLSGSADFRFGEQREGTNNNFISLGSKKGVNEYNLILKHYSDLNYKGAFSIDNTGFLFYVLDIANKTVSSLMVNGNQRNKVEWDTVKNNYVTPLSSVNRVGYLRNIMVGHYWRARRNLQQLSDGRMLCHRYGDACYSMVFTSNVVGKPLELASYLNDNVNYKTHHFTLTPVTPVKPFAGCTILYDKALTFGSVSAGGHLNMEAGSPKAWFSLAGERTYQILTSSLAPPLQNKGYELASQRTDVTALRFNLVAVVNKGKPHYHTAFFTSSNPKATGNSHVSSAIELIGKTVKLSQAVIDKLNNFSKLNDVMSNTEFNQLTHSGWSFIPSIGTNCKFGFLRVVNGWKKPNPNVVTGFEYSQGKLGQFLVTCTFEETTNEIVVSDVYIHTNESNSTVGHWSEDGNSYRITVGNGGTAVINVVNDDEVDVYTRINGGSAGVGGGNFTTANLLQSTFNGLATEKVKIQSAVVYREGGVGWTNPAWSIKEGLVAVYTGANGTLFYRFKANPDGRGFPVNLPGITSDQSYIVGAVRPKDGFSFTIGSPFPVFIKGLKYIVEPRTFDLTKVTPNPANKTFYLTFVTDHLGVRNPTGKDFLKLTETPPLEDTEESMFLATIETSQTEIISIDAMPVIRYHATRPSPVLKGSAFPVTTGHPFDQEDVKWIAGLRRPTGQYNSTGTAITGKAQDAKVIKLYNSNGVEIASVPVTAGTWDYVINLNPAHTSAQRVTLLSYADEKVSRPLAIRAPLIAKFDEVKFVDGLNKKDGVVNLAKAEISYYLYVRATGLSLDDVTVEVPVTWTNVGIPLTEIKVPLPDKLSLILTDPVNRVWETWFRIEFNYEPKKQ